jgi:hypothetical protein
MNFPILVFLSSLSLLALFSSSETFWFETVKRWEHPRHHPFEVSCFTRTAVCLRMIAVLFGLAGSFLDLAFARDARDVRSLGHETNTTTYVVQ